MDEDFFSWMRVIRIGLRLVRDSNKKYNLPMEQKQYQENKPTYPFPCTLITVSSILGEDVSNMLKRDNMKYNGRAPYYNTLEKDDDDEMTELAYGAADPTPYSLADTVAAALCILYVCKMCDDWIDQL